MSEFWVNMIGSEGRHRSTTHRSSDGRHTLRTEHTPSPTGDFYSVKLGHTRGESGGNRHVRTLTFPASTQAASVYDENEKRTIVAAPSPDLLTMIERHHEDPTNSWYALLDKLVEEYPEHFNDAVNSHVAARNAGAAEQYARAFTAAQRAAGVG